MKIPLSRSLCLGEREREREREWKGARQTDKLSFLPPPAERGIISLLYTPLYVCGGDEITSGDGAAEAAESLTRIKVQVDSDRFKHAHGEKVIRK